MTAARTPPTTMNGLRTRNRSEITPIRMTPMALKPQFQLPRPLAFFKVNAEHRGQVDHQLKPTAV